ncbi:alpha/beta-hydrolase [Tothia fuscella]|uniref:Carboxypeptidase n=1 Tax=Tothia fuscella TaxID=1048955 RepID=A0A9P4TVQ2_9PEZI|nr:alpha/beta-hydrolase [Tothia fuscella]
MLWVEQPAGTGFSQGLSYETSEEEVAKNFLGFMRNFEDTFSFRNKNIYISGESYAGMYVPYIADAMFSAKDKTYFNVQGTMIYDPSINSDTVLAGMQVVPYVNAFENLFNLNDTYMSSLRTQHTECGYADFLSKHFVYPPRSRGPMPSPPKTRNAKCGTIWSDIQQAVTRVNPCFNIYDIATTCPVLWDVLGFPGSFEYLPKGASIYFDRADVQKAINAPNVKWAECNDIALQKDTSLYSGLDGGPLTRVIDQSQRTIIAHGNFDFILLANGTLMSIQNMTWGGSRGFQQKPKNDFFVPYHNEREKGSLAASGVMGVTHTERKLTWVEVFLSGHMVPQYQPSAAYRQMEFLLGRIASLEEVSAFTTQPGVAQPVLGKGAGTYAGNGSVPSRELFGEGEDRRVRLVTDRGFL